MRKLRTLGLFFGMLFSVGVTLAGNPPATQEPVFTTPHSFERLAHVGNPHKGGFLPSLGNWFDPNAPGWGFDIQQVGDLLFVIWFTYLPNGRPVWYLAVAELDGMSWTADLEFYKWDFFSEPGSQATAAVVGTITIVWSDENNAVASWTLDGISNSASISFAEFATGPTLANMTGHYFQFWAPGWGWTLLTQGEVTVITMYFYKNSQPIWLQGVVTAPGFRGFADMNFFNAPDLCPSCLGKANAKSSFSFELALRLRAEYTPGTNQESTLFVEESIPGATGFGPTLGDIPLGIVPTTGSSITGAYMNGLMFMLDQPGFMPPSCIPFQYRSNLMSSNPMPTGPLDTHYASSERDADGNREVFNDPACQNRNILQSRIDGEFHVSWIQDAITNPLETDKFAIQFKWFIDIPDAFSFGGDSCDMEEGIGGYAIRTINRSMAGAVTGFTINGTGTTNYDLQRCGQFSFSEFIFLQDPVPGNQHFVEQQNDEFMFRSSVQSQF